MPLSCASLRLSPSHILLLHAPQRMYLLEQTGEFVAEHLLVAQKSTLAFYQSDDGRLVRITSSCCRARLTGNARA